MKEQSLVCPNCSAVVRTGGGQCPLCLSTQRPLEIKVEGADASEVGSVTRELMEAAARSHEVKSLRSPWVSGSFYIAIATAILAVLLVGGSLVPAWVFIPAIVGAVLLVSVVGAMQLRQDDRLSDEGFVTLMGKAIQDLPAALSRKESKGPDE